MNFKKQHSYYFIAKLFSNVKEVIGSIIAMGVLTSRSDSLGYLIIVVSILIFINVLVIFIGWYKEVYKIEDRFLYAKKGVFIVKDISIPFEKVQTVDISESAFQRLFKVCKIQIETSGGDALEKEFEVIVLKKEALQMKNSILIRKDYSDKVSIEKEESNYNIGLKDIFIASITSTQFTIGFSIIFSAIVFLQDLVPDKYTTTAVQEVEGVLNQYTGESILYKILVIILFLVIIAFILSFIAMIIKYYNFSLIRKEKSLKISYGLLNKKEVTIPINKILSINIKEGLLRKPFGFCEVKISSIGYGNESGEKAILCPLIKKKKLYILLQEVLPEFKLNNNFKSVSKNSRFSYLGFYELIILTVCIIVTIFVDYGYFSFILPLITFIFSYFQYKDNGLDYSEKTLYLRKRKIALSTYIIPKNRIQSVGKVSNYFSRKKSFSKVKIYIQDIFMYDIVEIKGIDDLDINKLLNWYKKSC